MPKQQQLDYNYLQHLLITLYHMRGRCVEILSMLFHATDLDPRIVYIINFSPNKPTYIYLRVHCQHSEPIHLT